MTIGVSHGGGANILTADAPSDEALVGTVNGVVRIVRGAAGWTETERTLEGNHIHALVQDPKSGVWFCGVEHGGHLRQRRRRPHLGEARRGHHGGGHLQPLRCRGERRDAGVRWNGACVPFRQRRPRSDMVGEACASCAGDGGVALPCPAARRAPEAHQLPPGRQRASCTPASSRAGLYRSDDGGDTFTEIPGMYNDVHRLVSNPADPQRMFVTGWHGAVALSRLRRDVGQRLHPRQRVRRLPGPAGVQAERPVLHAGDGGTGESRRVAPERHGRDARLPQPRRRRDVGGAERPPALPTSSCRASRR